jgi:hypothetical protein
MWQTQYVKGTAFWATTSKHVMHYSEVGLGYSAFNIGYLLEYVQSILRFVEAFLAVS